MKFILLLALFTLASCSSTQQISENLYMASCDGVWGGCEGEMESQCPGGYKVLKEKTEIWTREPRTHIHFQCTGAVSSNN